MPSSEQQIYNALISAGLNTQQAAGVLGNVQSESGFNVEANAIDSNGKRSVGMVQWNAGSYNINGLVTGNVSADLAKQVQFLLHNTNNISKGLSGSTAAQVAGNFAQFVEVCQGCNPGGSSYNQRVAQAQRIYQQAVSGNWGSGAGVVSSQVGNSAGSNGGTTAQNAGLIPGLDPKSWIDAISGAVLKAFGVPDLKDVLERFGLMLIGAGLVLVGVHMMGRDITRDITGSKDESKASAPTERKGAEAPEETGTGTAEKSAGAAPDRVAVQRARKGNLKAGRAATATGSGETVAAVETGAPEAMAALAV